MTTRPKSKVRHPVLVLIRINGRAVRTDQDLLLGLVGKTVAVVQFVTKNNAVNLITH